MRIATRATTLLAAAVVISASVPAWAGQIAHTRPYDFELFTQINQTEGHVHFVGDQTVYVPKFDEMGGQKVLWKVKLEIGMTISGGLQPLPEPIDLVEMPCAGCIEDEYVTATPYGRAESGPLVANVVFDPPSYMGEVYQDVIDIYFEGDGMDMTETLLADFIDGGSDIPIDVFADLDVQYPVGVPGIPLSLIAQGNVRMTYIYKDAVIPTPAALIGGMALLGMIGLRRRR